VISNLPIKNGFEIVTVWPAIRSFQISPGFLFGQEARWASFVPMVKVPAGFEKAMPVIGDDFEIRGLN
jgi:hypothetical protein